MFVVVDLRKSKSTNKSRSGKVMPNYRQFAIVELGHVFCLLCFVFYLFVLFFCIGFIPSASNASISDYTCVYFFLCSCNEHVLFWWNELLKFESIVEHIGKKNNLIKQKWVLEFDSKRTQWWITLAELWENLLQWFSISNKWWMIDAKWVLFLDT